MSWGKRAEMIVHEQDPYNAEPPPGLLADAFITPTDVFYSRNHGPIPDLDPETWSLRVDGQVSRPLTLTLDQLQAFEHVTLSATLQCAGNRRADLIRVRDIPGEHPWGRAATSTATWTGVRLRDVLDAAGLDPTLTDGHVAFDAPDVSPIADPPQPYGGSVPLTKARGPEVLLAWAMNGEPLTQVHGARCVSWCPATSARAASSGSSTSPSSPDRPTTTSKPPRTGSCRPTPTPSTPAPPTASRSAPSP